MFLPSLFLLCFSIHWTRLLGHPNVSTYRAVGAGFLGESVVRPYGFTTEVMEIITQNNLSSFYSCVSNFLLYCVGDSMRGMAMSLANRPYLLNNCAQGKKLVFEEKKCDTQAIIDERRT